jgi:hypothetical protein
MKQPIAQNVNRSSLPLDVQELHLLNVIEMLNAKN